MALGLRRDRRILTVLIVLTCTAFINEGIVLDNSIRLGSAQGHLNPDTHVLALLLSAVNCLNACYAAWLGFDLALREEDEAFRPRPEEVPQDNRLHWKKWDTLLLCLILGVYSAVCFPTLGSTKAPQTAWTSTDYTENVVLDLGEEQDSFLMLYFARVSRYDFSVSVSDDGETWREETWAQMDQGQCWKWKYVTDSTMAGGRDPQLRLLQPLVLGPVCAADRASDQSGPVRGALPGSGTAGSCPLRSVEPARGGSGIRPCIPIRSAAWMSRIPWRACPFGLLRADQADGEENPRWRSPPGGIPPILMRFTMRGRPGNFLTGAAPYETSHPPLGKVLMSWGVALFGMTPFGWRFAGALAGVAMLAGMYLLGKQLTKSAPACRLWMRGLMALDCMHLTQTQIATIDSFPVLFICLPSSSCCASCRRTGAGGKRAVC